MANRLICRTCCKPISAPYRVYDDHGKVIQGCIDADHDGGGLIGESARWHNRKEAKAYRRKYMTQFNRCLLGDVNTGY